MHENAHVATGFGVLGSRPVTSDLTRMATLGAFGGMAVGLGALAARPGDVRFSLIFVMAILMLGLAIVVPRNLVYALVIWLAALGTLRRLLPGTSGSLDAMLTVAPAGLAILFLAGMSWGGTKKWSMLTKAVALLTVLAAAGTINPLQGNVGTGLAGLFLLIGPLLAFWFGRSSCDDRMLTAVFWLVAILGLGAAAYGMFQILHGFPSWDSAWIGNSGYTALNVGGIIRPFASFASAEEYAYFTAAALIIWLGFGLRRNLLLLTTAAVGLLATAALYASVRASLVLLLVALSVMLACRLRLRSSVAALLGLAFLGVVFGVVSRLGVSPVKGDVGSQLIAHQVAGLANPLDPHSSTLLAHIAISGKGFRSMLHNPVGLGTGSVSLAASKFGGQSAGTELDPSNAGVAFGVPGFLAYLAILGLGLSKSYQLARTRGDALPRVACAILVVTLFQWLNGGMYLVAIMPWLILGWLDGHEMTPEGAEPPPDPGDRLFNASQTD